MLNFEWDKRKAKSNKAKHGVSFEEAATVFGDPLSLVIDDPDHSDGDDERLIIIGMSNLSKLLVVVHCEKSDDLIRIISARKATSNERHGYEQG